jgi:hypothetical protein
MREFNQEKRVKFLQFCTGSGCMPIEMWEMRVHQGRDGWLRG